MENQTLTNKQIDSAKELLSFYSKNAHLLLNNGNISQADMMEIAQLELIFMSMNISRNITHISRNITHSNEMKLSAMRRMVALDTKLKRAIKKYNKIANNT